MPSTAAAPLPAEEPRLFLEAGLREPVLLQAFDWSLALYSRGRPGQDAPNEDAAAVLPYDARSGLLVVADGVGGLHAGEEAARTAVEGLREAVERARREEGSLREAVLDGIERANTRLLARGDGAATTLAVLEVAGRSARPYHLGDAEILVCGQRGKLKHRTVAHTPVGFGVEAGLLDEQEALHHADRHLVSNVLGAADMRIEIGPRLDLARFDTAILGSDGLFDNLTEEELVDLIRKGPLRQAAHALARRIGERMREVAGTHPSKPDDLTFVLARPPRPTP